jgi:hypothetical protein
MLYGCGCGCGYRIRYGVHGCDDMKIFKNLGYKCSYIYNKLLYKIKNNNKK